MGKKTRNDKLLKKIATRIKQLRLERNLTQEDFYNDTGINIGRIECIKRDFSMSTLESICKYLKISIPDFFKEIE